MWVEYKGSFQGTRPGFLRTDTVKKAVANGALLRAIDEHPPFIVLTSHVPQKGAAFSMMTIAKDLGYIDDVICVNDPADVRRLAQL